MEGGQGREREKKMRKRNKEGIERIRASVPAQGAVWTMPWVYWSIKYVLSK